jgi:steroid delta-isomerase-like uncharacterized protein
MLSSTLIASFLLLAASAPCGEPSLRFFSLDDGGAAASTANNDQAQRNKSVARRIFDDVLSRGRYEVSDGLYTSDFVGHGGPRTFTHAESLAEARGWRSAFPDLQVTVDLVIAENDFVVVRWTARGTNTGTGNGIPATGKKVSVSGTAIFRFVDGKIAEEWATGDTLWMLRQLGIKP